MKKTIPSQKRSLRDLDLRLVPVTGGLASDGPVLPKNDWTRTNYGVIVGPKTGVDERDCD